MKDLTNTFYDEGFTIDVPKWTSFLSKNKARKFSFKQPAVYYWEQIAMLSQRSGLDSIESEDFEHLSRKMVWQAARIAGLNVANLWVPSFFYALYFFTHLPKEKLGKLAYMVILLNRTEYHSYAFRNLDAIFWANMPDHEKAAIAGTRMYK